MWFFDKIDWWNPKLTSVNSMPATWKSSQCGTINVVQVMVGCTWSHIQLCEDKTSCVEPFGGSGFLGDTVSPRDLYMK